MGDDSSEVEEMFVVKKVTRVKPPAKIPLGVIGSTFALASGSIYGYTFKLNKEFYASTNSTEVKEIQTDHNYYTRRLILHLIHNL